MRRLTLILALTLISLPLLGGEIYVVNTKGDADVIVYVTNKRIDADLEVYRTQTAMYSRYRDDWWTFVNYKLSSTIKVYFTTIEIDADVVIIYTSNSWRSGWIGPRNKFRGKFSR